MEKIYIVTDSASDLSREEVEKYNIDEIIPIKLNFEGNTIREYYDITKEEYYKVLMEDEIPQTSQTTPADYYTSFQKASKEGYNKYIAVILNSKGSGSFQSANIAKELYYNDNGKDMEIQLIDSLSYSYMYGALVMEIADMRNHGASFESIIKACHEYLPKVEAVLGVYTLKHLKKSGRVSGAAAFVGEALGLKPISLVSDGDVTVIEKARGEKKLLEKMIETVKERGSDFENQTAYVVLGDVAENTVNSLEKPLLDIGFKEVKKVYLGASITTNAGPNSLAIVYNR